MAGFLHDDIFDTGLTNLTSHGSRLDICSAQPLVYADIAGYSLGYKAPLSISSPADRSAGGREVTVSPITDGVVTGNGTAGYYAISDGSAKLYASQQLSSSQVVSNGNAFTLTSFKIGIPDPA
jgi:hypothetical protein